MQRFEVLATADLALNDPRRESCESPGCDQLASYRLLTTGGTPAGFRMCIEHAGMHAGAFDIALPDA